MPNKKPNIHYFKLAGILFFPLLILIFYSFGDEELSIGDFVLQKAPIGSCFLQKRSVLSDTIPADSADARIADAAVTDTTAQRILLFGDSMVEGLSKRMRRYAAANGHELLNVIWYSSSTKIWSESDTLAHFIHQFQPTYLMLCLGGNELSVRDLDKRDRYIKTLIGKFGDRPYVWIGPPNWKEDTGLNRLIEKNTGSSRYFPSKKLTFQRKKDGAHPTDSSAFLWMDSLAVWVKNEASCRIRMAFPENDEQCGRTIVLQPLK